MTDFSHEVFIDENELSQRLGIKVRTLRDWRTHGSRHHGPVWFKMGQAVRYKLADVDDYIEQCRRP